MSTAEAVAAGAGANQEQVARQARCACALREEDPAGGCEETEGDAVGVVEEGAFSGTSGGVVLDEADGMSTPQAVGDERLAVDENRLAPWEALRSHGGSPPPGVMGRRTSVGPEGTDQPTFLSTS